MPHCCQNHVIRYCEKVYEKSGKKLFCSIINSGEVLNKLKSRGIRANSLSTYDFSTLYTTLPHNVIKQKLIYLIEWTFKMEGSPYIASNERQAFFNPWDTKRYKLWSCKNVCETLIYCLDNIYIRFGTKLYRQIAEIIEAFKSTSRYLNDLLNIDNPMKAWSIHLQLNKANASDTEAPFLDLHLSISNEFVSS